MYRPTSQDSPSLGSDRGHHGGKGENGTAAFPGKSRNRDGFARSAGIQVLFLWVHDWIPLGRLNDVAAVRSQDTGRRLVTVTLIQSVPWTIGLCFSLLHFRRPYPGWLYDWLVISYGLLFIGQIRAWWIPYLSDRNRSELLAIKSCSA